MSNEQKRAAFEAWYGEYSQKVSADSGGYQWPATRRAWDAWQAALASPEAQALQLDLEQYVSIASELATENEALRKDAERYRWMRNESWAGYNSGSGKPRVAETIVITQDGAGNVKTILAEDALDVAIDAAMEKQK